MKHQKFLKLGWCPTSQAWDDGLTARHFPKIIKENCDSVSFLRCACDCATATPGRHAAARKQAGSLPARPLLSNCWLAWAQCRTARLHNEIEFEKLLLLFKISCECLKMLRRFSVALELKPSAVLRDTQQFWTLYNSFWTLAKS